LLSVESLFFSPIIIIQNSAVGRRIKEMAEQEETMAERWDKQEKKRNTQSLFIRKAL
jgi:hypothetical protein